MTVCAPVLREPALIVATPDPTLPTPPPNRLRNFDASAPRRRNALGTGYTWFVRVLRFALPLVALILIGVVIARLAKDPQGPTLTTADLPQNEKTIPGQIEMVQAKYQGMDAKGHAYTLSADTATRDIASPDTVLLDKPRADVVMPDGAQISLNAGSGTYNTATGQMTLSDQVTLRHDNGYEMYLQDAKVDVNAHTASTTKPVRAKSDIGELSAQSMDIQNEGNLIVFSGPATLVIYSLSGNLSGTTGGKKG